MAQRTKKWVVSVCITIFTLLAVFCMINVIGDSGAFAQEESVTATGRRTITQTSTVNATDLHFVVYQADVNSAYILDWRIKLSVPFSNMTAVPGSWPFNDGKTHSVAIDIYGIDVPPGAKVNIEAILNLNEYNTVKFHDIHWTYGTQGPVKPINADVGWAVATNPGSSSGGWLISKYTATDLNNNQIVDLAGHEFLPTHVSPALQDMSISNGTPDNPGTSSPVRITNWSVAIVPTLPSWEEIDNWQGWYSTYPGPIILNPGETVQFPGILITPTPTRRIITPTPTLPTPTPTRRAVIAKGRRTITQTSDVNATDLHFVVYQADVDTAYILDSDINLSVPYGTMTKKTSSWPFDDGKNHWVEVDIYGIDVPPGERVNIEAILYLNQYNTVKFYDIHWTYSDQEPVEPINADIGWAVKTDPGSSKGGWLISKYTATDQNNNQIVDLVGHEFLSSNASPTLKDMSISNGTPDNPGSSTVTITDWSVAVVSTLPSWDEINNWQHWDASIAGPITLVPGQTIQFPGQNAVIATERRTITQTSSVNATDLHFVVYQADINTAHILGWGIKLSVPYTTLKAVPSSWPFYDGKTHSVAIDIYGINVPPGTKVDIEAILYLNQYNTVKFHDIHWTYDTQGPVKPIDADIGWAVATNPGSSSGGWLISKYKVTDQKQNEIVDLAGHEFLPTHVKPAFQDMSISNGTPDNPGTSTVTISNWSVAIVSTLPSWEEIDNWQNWDASYPGLITLKPGETVHFPTGPTPTRRVTITPTPTRRITPTPTRRTVTPPPTFRAVTNTPTPTLGPGGIYIIIIYVIQSDWGTGATVIVTIVNNTSITVNGWTLEFTFPGNQTITNLWNGTFTQSGAAVSVRDNGFNATIGANGGSVNFGFNCAYSGNNLIPTSFTLNGTACAVQ